MAMKNTIEEKLSALIPIHLRVENESHMHSVPENSETHFKVELVSDSFQDMRPVKRHQMVYQLLGKELDGGVHALALHLYTPDELRGVSPEPPNCHGGTG